MKVKTQIHSFKFFGGFVQISMHSLKQTLHPTVCSLSRLLRDQQGAELTNQHGNQHATNPLLQDLLYLWFGTLGHDGKGVGMRHRAHSGSTEPGDTNKGRCSPHGHKQEEVKVES